jgi:hypothetical protein
MRNPKFRSTSLSAIVRAGLPATRLESRRSRDEKHSMSELNSNTEVVTIDETAVKAEAQRILSNLASKHKVAVESFTPEVAERAVEQARTNLEQAAKDESNPYKKLYEAERQQREIVENTLQSIRTQGVKSSTSAGGPPVSAAQAKARAGAHEWNHRLTDNQKIAALGIAPDSVSTKEAAKVFGRGADTKLATDLHKSDPSRYRILREVAIAVGSYGA